MQNDHAPPEEPGGGTAIMFAVDWAMPRGRDDADAADLSPLSTLGTGFAAASERALGMLRQRYDFGLWMVTRVVDDDWIVLAADDVDYGVSAGTLFRWADSFCSRMVQGEGPRLAPVADEVPAYRDARIGKQFPIGSYVGVPLRGGDGELVGTLCAIHPEPRDNEPSPDLEFLELIADLLAVALQLDIAVVEHRALADSALSDAHTDSLTGLANRRAWELAITSEEVRCLRYGSPAAVFIIDLDDLKVVNDRDGHGAGDDLIRRAADALREAAREPDVVARLGGDEFGVMAIECDRASAEALATRIRAALGGAGVHASVGYALRRGGRGGTLSDAEALADARMYQDKHRRAAVSGE